MSRSIMLIPIGTNVGLNSISLGIIHAIKRKGICFSIFKTISQSHSSEEISNQITIPDCVISSVSKDSDYSFIKKLEMNYIDSLLSNNQKDMLMEEIIANFYENTQNSEVVLVEGLTTSCKQQFTQSLNFEIAKTLNTEVVFVMSHNIDTLEQLKKRIKLIYSSFGSTNNSNITGVIINKLNALADKRWYTYFGSSGIFSQSPKREIKIDLDKLQSSSPLPILGAIPWNFDLVVARAIDVARHLDAVIINKGDISTRRVRSVIFCSQNIPHVLEHLCAGSLLVISTDRSDILTAVCLAVINGLEISAILLIGDYKIDTHVSKLYEHVFNTGLPIFMVKMNDWETSLSLQRFNLKVPIDDHERIKRIREYIANYIDINWIESLTLTSKRKRYLSPPTFRYQLTKLARKAKKRIVLPEGNEPRIVRAAAICAERGIAACVLLGNLEEINSVARSQGIRLDSSIEIIDPKAIRENYISRLVELRKNKGMTEFFAREQLKDNVVLGTLMLEKNEVNGLVSGAVHTTANTIRPSLQLIKTAPGNSLVSSIFFMLLPEQVYVYGDCAINLNPTAEQLAEIAIQSANSAIAFGIEPRVAMLSYSTGSSGSGNDVEKVRKATWIVQKQRPDLMVDGPLQYDAAVMIDVAKSKAPHSPVAGHATVFIFPDLNTGNITYKAVQRSANIVSIGPMLQGMRKPVNDLSRGALVDDIVYTIALTVIQSSQ